MELKTLIIWLALGFAAGGLQCHLRGQNFRPLVDYQLELRYTITKMLFFLACILGPVALVSDLSDAIRNSNPLGWMFPWSRSARMAFGIRDIKPRKA